MLGLKKRACSACFDETGAERRVFREGYSRPRQLADLHGQPRGPGVCLLFASWTQGHAIAMPEAECVNRSGAPGVRLAMLMSAIDASQSGA